MIDWIDENVAVGNWMDARNIEMLQEQGIDMIVDSRILFDDSKGRKNRVPLPDRIMRNVGLITDLAGKGGKVLIRCYHGRDRSPFVAMIYLSRKMGITYHDAYHLVKTRREITVFHWDWVEIMEGRRNTPDPNIGDGSSD